MRTICGMPVQISGRIPRMQCSPEFVRLQSPELVAKTNAWMADWFGYDEIVPDGQILKLHDRILVMNAKTYEQAMLATAYGNFA